MGKDKENLIKLTLGYIRCSSEIQVADGETLSRQREMILAYGLAKGLGDIEIIADEGISGFKSARPGFQKLLELCRTGNVKTVIVYDLSRLSRSVRDTIGFVEDVVQKHGIALVSLQQDLDTSTPHGKAFLAFIAVFNELYRNEISHKTKVALAHKKAKGERYCGITPFGFDATDCGRFVTNHEDLRLAAEIQRLRTQGLSLRKIAAELEKLGIPSKSGKANWSQQVIKDILTKFPVASVQEADNILEVTL
jgi:DNA invertase Pin-like site-specific DNA recombinase